MNRKRESTTFIKANRAVVVGIAAVIIASIVFVGAYSSSVGNGHYVCVHAGDGRSQYLPLDTDTFYEVQTELGSNTIVIENETVRVAYADCPNHDCIKQGSIERVGEQIVCLPHKLWVEVTSDSSQGEPDFDSVSR